MASRKFKGTIEVALKDLINERAIVDDAIQKLQSLLEGKAPGATATSKKKRGRPAGSLNARKALASATSASAASEATEPGTKRKWSPAARRKAAERMKAYWAKQRKQKSPAAGTTKKARRA
ncbi:MAG: hypothetical protein EOO40_03565 [Deltaproteobacteria bacterium]|nr:MAG: hypothetical protein EOO40_03565 [Deltaproteobacteria bacterium]